MDGYPKHQSPPDMSLITCVSIAESCNVVAYGCYNGSVRLYYIDSGAVKTLGSHREKVKDVDITLDVVIGNMEMVAVASGSKDGSLNIWWDGGHAFTCVKKHSTPIVQVIN